MAISIDMQLGIYTHPDDLEDLKGSGGLSRLVDLGFGEIAVASSYHAGRWLTPWSPGGLVRSLDDGVVHFHPGDTYGDLRPMEGRVTLPSIIEEARELGLRTTAWTVLFHNSRLGREHPRSCVHNAFGDIYTYALCPARPEVREYGIGLLCDLAAHESLDAIELEAAGFMGYRHGSHHGKASLELDAAADFLLSYCFCDACCEGLVAQGVEPAALQDRVREEVRHRIGDADAMTPGQVDEPDRALAEALGEDAFAALLAHRRSVHVATLKDFREAVGDRVALAVQIQPDPLFTGSQLGQDERVIGPMVDELVLTHYGEAVDRIAEIWGQLSCVGPARATIWPKAPALTSDTELRAVRETVQSAGGQGLRIYELGLLPWATIERVAAALAG